MNRYLRQLDSLRAIAIVTVVIVHWCPKGTLLYNASAYFNAPSVFFTLSGFLITAILLKEKDRAGLARSSRRLIYRNFVIKRIFRLLPAYLAVIALWYFTTPGNEPIRYKYYLTFTTNFYIYKIQQWPALAHLWSMSVEEQYYLFWPLMVLLFNKRVIPLVAVIFVLIGLVSQHVLAGNLYGSVLTFCSMDSLGIGGLLAWLVSYKMDVLLKWKKTFAVSAFISFLLLVMQMYLQTNFIITDRMLASVITAWGIYFFLNKPPEQKYFLSFVFENQFIMKIGKLSYGIYLYHFLIPYFTYKFFSKLNSRFHWPVTDAKYDYLWFTENFVLLLGIAFLSYHYFEQSLQRFGKNVTSTPYKLSAKKIALRLPQDN